MCCSIKLSVRRVNGAGLRAARLVPNHDEEDSAQAGVEAKTKSDDEGQDRVAADPSSAAALFF